VCEIGDNAWKGDQAEGPWSMFFEPVELSVVIIVDLSQKYPPAQVCNCLVGGFNFSRAWAHHVGTKISHVQAAFNRDKDRIG
jgi:hypothetical protein